MNNVKNVVYACMHLGHTDGSPFPSAQIMTSPAAANWPGSPGMPRPSPARPGQSPGGYSALHSPEQLKSGIFYYFNLFMKYILIFL